MNHSANLHSWLDRSGTFFPVKSSHIEWLHRNRLSGDAARKMGLARVQYVGSTLYADLAEPLTHYQKRALVSLALETGRDAVVQEVGDKEHVVWLKQTHSEPVAEADEEPDPDLDIFRDIHRSMTDLDSVFGPWEKTNVGECRIARFSLGRGFYAEVRMSRPHPAQIWNEGPKRVHYQTVTVFLTQGIGTKNRQYRDYSTVSTGVIFYAGDPEARQRLVRAVQGVPSALGGTQFWLRNATPNTGVMHASLDSLFAPLRAWTENHYAAESVVHTLLGEMTPKQLWRSLDKSYDVFGYFGTTLKAAPKNMHAGAGNIIARKVVEMPDDLALKMFLCGNALEGFYIDCTVLRKVRDINGVEYASRSLAYMPQISVGLNMECRRSVLQALETLVKEVPKVYSENPDQANKTLTALGQRAADGPNKFYVLYRRQVMGELS